MGASAILALPTELLDLILDLLDRNQRLNLSATSKHFRTVTLPFIWREVSLTDIHSVWTYESDTDLAEDPHDDTQIAQKLLVLASNPEIAAHVESVSHSCWLDGPRNSLIGQTLSYDPRLLQLLKLAIQNMKRVHTLRIVGGHLRLTEALIRGFFATQRRADVPVRRLWLENCSISSSLERSLSEHKHSLPLSLDFSSLQSIRFRDVFIGPHCHNAIHASARDAGFIRAAENAFDLHDRSCLAELTEELDREEEDDLNELRIPFGHSGGLSEAGARLTRYFSRSNRLDDRLFDKLTTIVQLPAEVIRANTKSHEVRAWDAYYMDWPFDVDESAMDERPELRSLYHTGRPATTELVLKVFLQCTSSLTSLVFDAIDMQGPSQPSSLSASDRERCVKEWFADLFALRFNNLRSLQFRLGKQDWWPHLMPKVYLFGQSHWPSCTAQTSSPESQAHLCDDGYRALDFLDHHTHLNSLAWPVDLFFPPNEKLSSRADSVIARLAKTLTWLRIESRAATATPVTDPDDSALRQQRRRFVTDFAAKMFRLETLKISDGIPLDESREIIRALQSCSLIQISIGGVHCPYTGAVLPVSSESPGQSRPRQGPSSADFIPTYGWQHGSSILAIVSESFASSIRQLKFGGNQGAVSLFEQSWRVDNLFLPLKKLDALELLVLNINVDTYFEGADQYHAVNGYWCSIHSPTTTSLVRTNTNEPEQGTWAHRIWQLSPKSMAERVTCILGPRLSPRAIKLGVEVRVCFVIGPARDTFDFDVIIGERAGRAVCLEYTGPFKRDFNEHRKQRKLRERAWF